MEREEAFNMFGFDEPVLQPSDPKTEDYFEADVSKIISYIEGLRKEYLSINDENTRLKELVESIFAQPIDRIIFPISKKVYTKFRDESLAKIEEYMGRLAK